MAKSSSKTSQAKLQAELKELTDALKRERADAINLRRRHDNDIASLRARVKASVVADLLPVIDNFELALRHTPKELESTGYVKGIEAIVRQFEQTIKDLGVERIKTVGEPFDPRLHEAVSVDEGEGEGQHIISEEIKSGYMIGPDVIRHALVKVKPE